MGFLLRVLEEDGTIVEEVIADLKFNPVRGGLRPAEFPMLGTLDPYGDTSLNYLQCELLEAEIGRAAAQLEQMGVANGSSAEIVRLSWLSRAKPQRRLVFIGD